MIRRLRIIWAYIRFWWWRQFRDGHAVYTKHIDGRLIFLAAGRFENTGGMKIFFMDFTYQSPWSPYWKLVIKEMCETRDEFEKLIKDDGWWRWRDEA